MSSRRLLQSLALHRAPAARARQNHSRELSKSRGSRLSRGAREAGFTLIELMVVVIMVGILAIMAAPSMLEAQKNRRAYSDAAQVMQLFRNARSRAIGDQAAVTIEISLNNSASSSTDRGTMIAYEATYSNDVTKLGMQASMDSCGAPSKWDPTITTTSGPHPVVVDGLNLNSQTDDTALVHVAINGVMAGHFAYCFTPSGKMYTWNGADFANTSFVTSPTTVPLKISVSRETNTLTRDVLVMPSGSVRISSRTS